jgi:drug/metabolite transporter (DMT)-like permease
LQEKKALPLTDLQLLLVAVLWGSDFIFVKIALREISPLSFMAMRSLITTAAFFPFFLKQEKKWSVRPRDFWGLVAIAFLGSFINRVFFSLGLNLTTASNASLLITTAPLFVLLTSSFFSRSEITSRSVLGIVVAFAGVFFVIKRDWKEWALITDYLEGDLYMVGAAFFWALFNVFARPFLKEYSSVKVMAYVMIFGTIFYFPFLPNEKGGNGWQVSALAWFCLFYGPDDRLFSLDPGNSEHRPPPGHYLPIRHAGHRHPVGCALSGGNDDGDAMPGGRSGLRGNLSGPDRLKIEFEE